MFPDNFDDITPEELEQRALAADVELAKRKAADPFGITAAQQAREMERQMAGRNYAGWTQ